MVPAQISCKKRTPNFAYRLTRLAKFQLKSEYRTPALHLIMYDVRGSSLAAQNFIISIFLGSIIKQLASNKDDRKRVEKALDVSGLPSGKGDTLPHNKFHFEDFFNLYKNLTQRSEVEKIFEEL